MIKTNIENRFFELPNASFFDQVYYNYLRITGRNHFNGVTFLKDGRLMFDSLNYNLFLKERTDGFIDLCIYFENTDTPFLFVRTPSKLKDNSEIPRAFSDNEIIQNADDLLQVLYENNVDTLDLRAVMDGEGIDYIPAFFHGDHHWTAKTALWAFDRIIDKLNSEYGFSIGEMTRDLHQYEHITYANAFLGEESEAVNAFNNYEDITVLVPKFPTDFIVTDNWDDGYREVAASGDFIDVFVPKVHNEHNDIFHYGDLNNIFRIFFRYENKEAPEKKSVLFIADSMGIPLSTYFAATFEKVDFLYLVNRQNHRLWSVVNENKYDFVIFLISDITISFEDEEFFENDRFFLGQPPYN